MENLLKKDLNNLSIRDLNQLTLKDQMGFISEINFSENVKASFVKSFLLKNPTFQDCLFFINKMGENQNLKHSKIFQNYFLENFVSENFTLALSFEDFIYLFKVYQNKVLETFIELWLINFSPTLIFIESALEDIKNDPKYIKLHEKITNYFLENNNLEELNEL